MDLIDKFSFLNLCNGSRNSVIVCHIIKVKRIIK